MADTNDIHSNPSLDSEDRGRGGGLRPPDIYSKLLDIILVVKGIRDRFSPYSANDLNILIDAALHNKKKMPNGIQVLYDLEQRIAAVRAAIELARE